LRLPLFYQLNDSESYNFSQVVWKKKSFKIKKTGKISSLKNTFEKFLSIMYQKEVIKKKNLFKFIRII